MTPSNPDFPPEFRDVAEMLERERPQMEALELDRVKRMAMARASRPASHGRSFMRSRVAILGMVVAGLLMSGSGAALGISSLTSTDSASVAQYGGGKPPGILPGPPPGLPPGPPNQEVLGEQETGGGGDGRQDNGGGEDVPETQRTRQQGTTPSSELPFTGYASIPILLVGLGLLSTGVVLRRRTRDSA